MPLSNHQIFICLLLYQSLDINKVYIKMCGFVSVDNCLIDALVST